MNSITVLLFAIGILILVALGKIPVQQKQPAEIGQSVQANGKIMCFSNGVSLSCLPVWLLERPNNWVVMYPHPTVKGQKK